MIRFADSNDIPQIKELWKSVFGDSYEAIDMFLDVHFICENTVVNFEGNRITSLFFLLDGKYRFKDIEIPSYYLYAACTHHDFRGKGIMGDMIEFASKKAESRGYGFIFLLPASESLYGYYEKFRFKPLYGKRTLLINSELKSREKTNIAFEEYSAEELAEFRNNAFENIQYFKWSSNAVDFAFKFNNFYSGQNLSTCKGYALYTEENQKVLVKEWALQNFRIEAFAKYIFSSTQCKEIVFNLPADDNSYEKSGMALPLNDGAKDILNSDNRIYLGLTLD